MTEIKAGDRVRIKPFEERESLPPMGVVQALSICLHYTEGPYGRHLGDDDPVTHEIECGCLFAEAIAVTKKHIAELAA